MNNTQQQIPSKPSTLPPVPIEKNSRYPPDISIDDSYHPSQPKQNLPNSLPSDRNLKKNDLNSNLDINKTVPPKPSNLPPAPSEKKSRYPQDIIEDVLPRSRAASGNSQVPPPSTFDEPNFDDLPPPDGIKNF